MDLYNEKVDFNEIYTQELNRVPTIFRFTRIPKIIACIAIAIPLLLMLIVFALQGHFVYGLFCFLFAVSWVFMIVSAVSKGNDQLFGVFYAITIVVSMFLHLWLSIVFCTWIYISVTQTNKAEAEAHKRYEELCQAQRYHDSNEYAKIMSDPNTYRALENYTDEDEFRQYQHILDENDTESETNSETVDPKAQFVSPMDADGRYLGSDKTRFCPTCSFAIMPYEKECPRCNK